LTDTDGPLGTVDFMSPEQLRGRRTDARSDVYALGCLLYTVLTGVTPFHRPTVAATITAHLESPPPRISARAGIPVEFDDVIYRALDKDPQRRYPSAGDLGRAALAAAEGEVTREVEQSVARGDAAPLADTRVIEELPEALQPTARIAVKEKKRRHLLVEVVVIAAFFLVALVVAAIAVSGSSSDPNRPLSSGDVETTAKRFAIAYAHEDSRALARLLSPDVRRVAASDVQTGRRAVVAAYASQFRSQVTRGYKLDGLKIEAGPVGRAEAHFTVERAGRPPITGNVVLGVERRHGRPRIRLIATESRT
jgi:serine/threonine-protein kinase